MQKMVNYYAIRSKEDSRKRCGLLFAKGLIYGPAEHDTCDMGMGSNMKVVDDQYMLYYFSVSMQVRISIYCNIHTVLFVAFSFQIRKTMIVLPRQARDKRNMWKA